MFSQALVNRVCSFVARASGSGCGLSKRHGKTMDHSGPSRWIASGWTLFRSGCYFAILVPKHGGRMKAIRFHQHGGPEVLKYEDAPEPVLRANEVLVRVKACALNRLDLWVRTGLPNVPIPLPHIPGSDVAGSRNKLEAMSRRLKSARKSCSRRASRAENVLRVFPAMTIAAVNSQTWAT